MSKSCKKVAKIFEEVFFLNELTLFVNKFLKNHDIMYEGNQENDFNKLLQYFKAGINTYDHPDGFCKVNGGTSYEILFSSLEPEIQKKLREAENKTTALVPHNYKEPDFVSDKTKLTANYREWNLSPNISNIFCKAYFVPLYL